MLFAELSIDIEHITTTPQHPFWVPQKGRTAAIDLRAGDRLQLLNGEYVVIEQIQHELLESPVTVYNFEVEGFHTYYVTDSAILVHNKCDSYTSPKGGGGVTQTINNNGKTIQFGHGGRHLAGTGLTSDQVNQAIANDVVTRPDSIGVSTEVSIFVSNVEIHYRYFTQPNGVINIGTYFPEK